MINLDEDKLKMLGYNIREEFGIKICKQPNKSTYIFIMPNGKIETHKWNSRTAVRRHEYFIKVISISELSTNADNIKGIALMPMIGSIELNGQDCVAENSEIQLFYNALILRIYNKITKKKYQFKMDRLCSLSGELNNVSNNRWIIGNTLIDLDNGDYYIFNNDEGYYKNDKYIILNCSSVLKYSRRNDDFKKFVVSSAHIFGKGCSIYIDIKSGSVSAIESCVHNNDYVQVTIRELITEKRRKVGIYKNDYLATIPGEWQCTIPME